MSRYFYLDVELGAAETALSVRRLVDAALGSLFGACGAAAVQVDVLRVWEKRALLRVSSLELRRLRAALALSERPLRVKAEAPTLQSLLKMTTYSAIRSGPGGKDLVIVAPREELAEPSKVILPEPEPAPGLILPDGSINWGCPCLGGMATGPCGTQFRDAFSCFHYSDADPKGSDCYEKFSVMQECMSHYPELYGKDDDDELAAALDSAQEQGSGDAKEPTENKDEKKEN